MNFAENLKRLRKRAKLSQEQLALACGFNGQSRISNYEASPDKEYAREPKLEEIPIIAKALGAEIGELFGQPPGAKATSDLILDPKIVSVTYRILRNTAKKESQVFDKNGDLAEFLQVYALCSAIPRGSNASELEQSDSDLAAAVAVDNVPNERARIRVSSDGNPQKKVARKVRDKT